MSSLDVRHLWETVRELADRVVALEFRAEQLVLLADPDRHPFTYQMLEANASRAQVDAALALMAEACAAIQAGSPLHHADFEERVARIFPTRSGSYAFAEGIVQALAETGQFAEVYHYYRQHGMNLGPLRDGA